MRSWSNKAERGSTQLIRLIVWLARHAGRPLCRALLYPITFYFLLTDRTARHASAQFLRAVNNRPTRLHEVFAHLYNFAATLLDRVYMAAGEFHRFEITLHGLPLLQGALQSGRGCVLMGSHLGSFDLLLLAQRALPPELIGTTPPISVMMRTDPRARLRRIVGIGDDPSNLIELGQPDSFLRAYEVLRSAGIVALLADRTEGGAASSSASLFAPFFGHRVALPIAPHVLAARSDAPTLFCLGVYEGGNRYRVELAELGPAAPSASRGTALQGVVDRYAAVLEHYARRYPLNWFNFYPYWPEPQDRS